MQKILKTVFYPYYQKDLVLLLLLGFSSGLPFLLILSTYSYWLNELQFSERVVSLFTIVSLPYCLKALIAPYVEWYKIPVLSKYFSIIKSWGVFTQCMLIILIMIMGGIAPDQNPYLSGCVALVIGLFSATQDIVVDALRLNRFRDQDFGLAASISGIGFHLGKLASGSGGLYLAHWYDWQISYQIMSLGIIPGLCALLAFHEGLPARGTACTHRQTPLRLSLQTLFKHKNIYYIIAFIIIFKMSDAVLQGTAATFLYQLGLTKIEFANYTKLYGTFWIIIGVTLGGFIVQWLSVYTAAIVAAFVQMCACLTFSIQAHIGYDPFVLGISIGLENFASGIVTCTLIAMISHFVRRSMFNVSHYTTLYAFGSLSRVSVSVSSGYLAYHMGWSILYLSLAFLFIPMFFLIYHLQKEHKKHIVYDEMVSFERDTVHVKSTKA